MKRDASVILSIISLILAPRTAKVGDPTISLVNPDENLNSITI